MLKHRLYYTLKPFVSWRIRMGLRRIAARRRLTQSYGVWPIDPAATRIPDRWPGWPNDKDFAFVLTHDVESAAGLAKCRRLAELEKERGFVSSFNFVPEGSYRVQPELRAWLTETGFEVGVHDLRHDGWLFESREKFATQAVRINQYLREWGAKGFRAGFMLRNLEWIHELDVLYDASTFDTDPFEMQSDGTGTIFPFWVSATDSNGSGTRPRNGYVELPYTLPQDSTLFLLLKEKSPSIWLKKLDWIVQQRGMALVNVHPDYLQFPGEAPSPRTFPVEHYLKLLDYARRRYAERFWQPVAKNLADYAQRFKIPPPSRRKRVCMVAHSFYENDNRVNRYATALAARGDQVDVLALRRSPSSPETETVQGVNIHRILGRSGKQERSKFAYFWSWIRFLARATRWIARQHTRAKYDILHIHNMPDFLVYAGWYPRLTGARVILDIHDITPEFYASKFGASRRTLPALILGWSEVWSARMTDHVIISNHLWLDKYADRTGTRNRCSVFINNVDTDVFRPLTRARQDGLKIIVFPGGLQWHQGLDIAIKAMPKVLKAIPEAEFHIYGDGNMKAELMALTQELGLTDRIKFFDPVEISKIAQIMADADVGVVPKRADSFGNEAYSTKIMEFMSVGVPVIISSTKIDRFYFDKNVARFFESGNETALAEELITVLSDCSLREQQVRNATSYVGVHAWSQRQASYLRIIDSLTSIGSAPCDVEHTLFTEGVDTALI